MSDSTKNYFAVLGLPASATADEIKRAFKELAFKNHPDRNPHNPHAEEQFKLAVEAYTFLTGNLEAYRALQSTRKASALSSDQVQDILKVLFDIETVPAATRARLLQAELELTPQEAFIGGNFSLETERYDLCPDCKGRGVEKGAKVFTCTYCFGAGEVRVAVDREETRECPKCNGRGLLSSRGCLTCRARGSLRKKILLNVAVPPLAAEGQALLVSRQGHEQQATGLRGDVEVRIRLKKDPRFTFDGKDVICETTVDMSDAALGGDILVPTLRGPSKFKLPPGTQSGQVFRLKGLGLGGDQFIKIQVRTPVVISEKDRHLLRQFQPKAEEGRSSFWQRIKNWFW